MKLKVLHNYRGKFNLASDEETHAFSMAIIDDDGKVIKNEEGIKALLECNVEESHYEFDEPFEYMSSVFDICFKEGNSYLYSSKPYIKQCLFFKKFYEENHAEIDKGTLEAEKEIYSKKIEELEKEIKWRKYFVENEESLLHDAIHSSELDRYRKLYEGWITKEEEKLKDIKEGSDTYNEIMKTIRGYKNKLELV